MADKLENGDYYLVNDNPQSIEYIDELVQNIMLSLEAKRGKFYPNKNFGSNILSQINIDSLSALTYARQALNSVDGVFVKDANINDGMATFELLINNEERQVVVQL